jgi:uncharacterized protein YkwD
VSDFPRHVDAGDEVRHRRSARVIVLASLAAAAVVVAGAVALLALGAGDSPKTISALPDAQSLAPARVGWAEVTVSPSPAKSPSTGPSSASPSARRSTAPPRTTAPAATGDAAFEAQVLTLVNQQRANAGCGAVTADSRLTSAARAHSADMANRNYFDHVTPEGVDPGTRITKAGYKWSAYGENIAEGYPDPQSVMTGWMNSPGHKANILNCNFKNLGVGLAYNSKHTAYWTQDFGRLM